LRDMRARIKRRVSNARTRVAHPTHRSPSAPARNREAAALRCY
jgi:hypothetical protein